MLKRGTINNIIIIIILFINVVLYGNRHIYLLFAKAYKSEGP